MGLGYFKVKGKEASRDGGKRKLSDFRLKDTVESERNILCRKCGFQGSRFNHDCKGK